MRSAPRRLPKCWQALFAIGLTFGGGACLADAPASADRFHISGFGTLGITHIDEPAGWAFTRDFGESDSTSTLRADLDSRLGLQLNFRATDRLEFVAQAVASRLAPDANLGDALEFAFAAFRPDANWTLRVGRVNMDSYLISDYRDVGFSYEFVRPPVEFYARSPTAVDGADLSRTWTSANAQWRAKIFGGSTSEGTGTSRVVLEPLVGLMLSREASGLLWRVSAVQTHLANAPLSLQPLIDGLHGLNSLPVPAVAAEADALARGLNFAGATTRYVAAGVQYDRHDWLISAEINRAQVSGKPWSSFSSGYASVGRRFGDLSVYGVAGIARRSAARVATPDWATPLAPFGPTVAQQAQYLAVVATQAANSLAGNQHTLSLGARWDLTTRIALKTQWDHIQVAADGGALWDQSTAAAATADVLSMVLDFVF